MLRSGQSDATCDRSSCTSQLDGTNISLDRNKIFPFGVLLLLLVVVVVDEAVVVLVVGVVVEVVDDELLSRGESLDTLATTSMLTRRLARGSDRGRPGPGADSALLIIDATL